MKIDFHTHGKLAKNLYFSKEYTKNMFSKARQSGLDAICLTEHFNTVKINEFFRYVLSISERDGDTLVLDNGLRIFPGIEIEIKEGGHILCIGKAEDIMAISGELAAHREAGSYVSFKELKHIITPYSILLGAGHPFRAGERLNLSNLLPEDLQSFDFVDLNGKDLAVADDDMEERVRAFAASINKPVLAGSDTHQERHYGVVYNIFKRDVNTIEELRKEILERRYEIYISDRIKENVTSALHIKSLLKQIDALGGDYVEAALRYQI